MRVKQTVVLRKNLYSGCSGAKIRRSSSRVRRSHSAWADGNLWSSRRGVHLFQEVEPLPVENSQFRNEFAASVSVGCFLQLANYRSVVCEREVTLQQAIKVPYNLGHSNRITAQGAGEPHDITC